MSALKALLFDVDGTLADTERDGHRIAFNQAFAEAGLTWHWDLALYGDLLQVTGGKERIQFFIERYQPSFTKPEDLTRFIAQLHKRKTHFYLELLQTGAIPLRSGVQRLLQEAREAGLRLAIVTTTTPENVTYLLKSNLGEESLAWFECIAAGDIVPNKKPAPDIYQYALAHMNLKPEECLAFEDSENGLKAALGAHIPTIVTVNAYTEKQDFTGALLVVDQLGEVDKSCKVSKGNLSESTYIHINALQKLYP